MTIKVGSTQDPANVTDAPRRRTSKVDTIRHAYGFDDVSLAPGNTTVEPADGGVRLRIASLRTGDGETISVGALLAEPGNAFEFTAEELRRFLKAFHSMMTM